MHSLVLYTISEEFVAWFVWGTDFSSFWKPIHRNVEPWSASSPFGFLNRAYCFPSLHQKTVLSDVGSAPRKLTGVKDHSSGPADLNDKLQYPRDLLFEILHIFAFNYDRYSEGDKWGSLKILAARRRPFCSFLQSFGVYEIGSGNCVFKSSNFSA